MLPNLMQQGCGGQQGDQQAMRNMPMMTGAQQAWEPRIAIMYFPHESSTLRSLPDHCVFLDSPDAFFDVLF